MRYVDGGWGEIIEEHRPGWKGNARNNLGSNWRLLHDKDARRGSKDDRDHGGVSGVEGRREHSRWKGLWNWWVRNWKAMVILLEKRRVFWRWRLDFERLTFR